MFLSSSARVGNAGPGVPVSVCVLMFFEDGVSDGFREGSEGRGDEHPGTAGVRPAGAWRQPWLVQGELAAGEADEPGPA